MIKKIVPHVILTLALSLFSLNSHALEANWIPAQEGNKIILIRHSLAPGSGDPISFKINDCKTQRNLNKKGIIQSKRIGKLFKKNKVEIDEVLSSKWCRCKDTAKYAFNKFIVFSALNSIFQSPYDKNKAKQLKEIKNFVKKWDGKGKNLVLITHYSIIIAITNTASSSGEIVVTDKNFNVLTTISTN